MNNECCKNCKWHDSFTWACCNGDSENCADFMDNDNWCKVYEGIECNEDTRKRD